MTAPALYAWAQGQGAVSADNLNTFQQTCDTVDQLRAFVGLVGMQVYARGIDAVADGGQGIFYWNQNSVAVDDNGAKVVAPYGATTGRWLRLSTVFPLSVVIRPFTASGTYIPSANLLYAVVELVGSGGGGGGVSGALGYALGGGGGGAGSYSRVILTADQIGSSQILTVNIGGAGGYAGANGYNGGAASFGAFVTAPGGSGGIAASVFQGGMGGAGGLSGSSSVGGLAFAGASGGFGILASIDTIAAIGGLGAETVFGGGIPVTPVNTNSINGASQTSAGCGGNGGAVNNLAVSANGGNGGQGLIIVTEYILSS